MRKWWKQRRDRRATLLAFNAIIGASYRRNIGVVLPGELPVIAPRASDYEEQA